MRNTECKVKKQNTDKSRNAVGIVRFLFCTLHYVICNEGVK